MQQVRNVEFKEKTFTAKLLIALEMTGIFSLPGALVYPLIFIGFLTTPMIYLVFWSSMQNAYTGVPISWIEEWKKKSNKAFKIQFFSHARILKNTYSIYLYIPGIFSNFTVIIWILTGISYFLSPLIVRRIYLQVIKRIPPEKVFAPAQSILILCTVIIQICSNIISARPIVGLVPVWAAILFILGLLLLSAITIIHLTVIGIPVAFINRQSKHLKENCVTSRQAIKNFVELYKTYQSEVGPILFIYFVTYTCTIVIMVYQVAAILTNCFPYQVSEFQSQLVYLSLK